MAKITLSDEEKVIIIDAINREAEPPPELMTKLFPHLAKKFDVAALDRAKIATLEYAGKRSEAAILNQTLLVDAGSPLQIERCFKDGNPTGQTQLDLFVQIKKNKSDWHNLIVQGDNLQFLKTCYQNQDPLVKDKVKGKVKLVYIDPPFATKGDFSGKEGEDSYADKIDRAEFIEQLRERLVFIRELMSEDGSIYTHLDVKMAHFFKIIMDEVFGKENFINEIIWRRAFGHSDSNKYGMIHDTILMYGKTKLRIWNKLFHQPDPEYINRFFDQYDSEKGERYQRISLSAGGLSGGGYDYEYKGVKAYWRCPITTLEKHDKEGRLHWPQKGVPRLKKYESEYTGTPLQDIWTDLSKIHNQSPELLGYPTQKPEALLERIIRASSNPGDMVMDVFAGSGTTGAVAEKLGRRWIMCDFGKHAIYTMQKRILRIKESNALEKEGSKQKKYNRNPNPFCVVSCGAYDFSRIMKLRENKEAYIDFVLGLFQLPRDEKGLNAKFKLENIYGEKDGDPVEVYPVWDDAYLKKVRIDADYLQEILRQSGGKLKGDYYIITPETCTVVNDTEMKNEKGEPVRFKLLKFPYKILEDVSRNFQIHEQPSSQENVNNLISSTGFYFNSEVDIKVKKIRSGLEITLFKTSLLDRDGNRYKGMEGLAMLLIDADYDGKVFDMEKTVFAKEIDDQARIKITGLSSSVAVIAIDRHGNESKPFILKD